MIINVACLVQEYWDLDCINMAHISELVGKILLHPITFYKSKITPFATTNGKKKTIDSLIIGPNKHVWLCVLINKLSRLSQGNNHGVQSTETSDLIFRSKVPNNCSITYA